MRWHHPFLMCLSKRSARFRGGAGKKSVWGESLLHYTLICEFKCGCLRFTLEMLHHDCGTAGSWMVIYFLFFPGLKITIACSALWPTRNQKELQAVVLALPPQVKEVNRNNPPKKQAKLWQRCEHCLQSAARGSDFFQRATVFKIASTECRCLECTRHINFS